MFGLTPTDLGFEPESAHIPTKRVVSSHRLRGVRAPTIAGTEKLAANYYDDRDGTIPGAGEVAALTGSMGHLLLAAPSVNSPSERERTLDATSTELARDRKLKQFR